MKSNQGEAIVCNPSQTECNHNDVLCLQLVFVKN